MPLSVAIEIAKCNTAEAQRELLKAFETKQLNGVAIRVVKRLIAKRRLLGNNSTMSGPIRSPRPRPRPTGS